MRRLDGIIDSMDVRLSKLREMAEGGGVWCAAGHGAEKRRTRLRDWTTPTDRIAGPGSSRADELCLPLACPTLLKREGMYSFVVTLILSVSLQGVFLVEQIKTLVGSSRGHICSPGFQDSPYSS